MKQFFLIFTLGLAILFSCTSKKDNNPLVKKNIAPSLEITGFENDTLVFVLDTDYPFIFKASDELIDPEIKLRVIGGTGQVTFLDTSNLGIFNATYKPFSRGEHKIEITISDGLADAIEILTVFFAANQPPLAVITATELSRDLENLLFTYEFSPSASIDRDSDITSASWNLDGNLVEKLFTETFQFTFDYYASYRIELTVTDEHDSTNTTVQTIDNSRPIASFTVTPSAEGQNGDNITLNAANSQSPNGDITSYMWLNKTPAGRIDILNEATTNRFAYTLNLPVGSNAIGLVVNDAAGNTSDTTWTDFTVLNTPPEADFDAEIGFEQIVITNNESEDIDPDDVLTFQWYVNDSLLQNYTDQLTPTINIQGDNFVLRLDVTDNHNATTSTSANLNVPGSPVAQFLILNVNVNNETHNLETATFDATASTAGNLSNGIDRYTWFIRPQNGLSTVLADTGAAFKELSIAHIVGVYEIGLIITNDEGLQSERLWQELTVLNSNPTAEFSVQSGASRSATVSSNNSMDIDPEQTINYFWFIDGIEDVAKRSIKLPIWTGLPLGQRTIMLRVEDNAGGSAELTQTVFIQ